MFTRHSNKRFNYLRRGHNEPFIEGQKSCAVSRGMLGEQPGLDPGNITLQRASCTAPSCSAIIYLDGGELREASSASDGTIA